MTSSSQPETPYQDPADGCLTGLALIGGVLVVFLATWFALSMIVGQIADWAGYTTAIDFNLDVGAVGALVFARWFTRSGWQRRLFQRFRVRPIGLTSLIAYISAKIALDLYRGMAVLTLLPTCQDISPPAYLPWGGSEQELIAEISQTYFVRRDSIRFTSDPWRPGSSQGVWTTTRASYVRGREPDGSSRYSRLTWTGLPARYSLIESCAGRPAGFTVTNDSDLPDRRRLTLYYANNLPVISGTYSPTSATSIEGVDFDHILWAHAEISDDPDILAQLMGCDGSCGEPINWISTEDVTARLRAMP